MLNPIKCVIDAVQLSIFSLTNDTIISTEDYRNRTTIHFHISFIVMRSIPSLLRIVPDCFYEVMGVVEESQNRFSCPVRRMYDKMTIKAQGLPAKHTDRVLHSVFSMLITNDQPKKSPSVVKNLQDRERDQKKDNFSWKILNT